MTQLNREATQESAVTPEVPQMLYCIEHEGMYKVTNDCHIYVNGGWEWGEYEICCFPLGYTYCPPPVEVVLPDDWAAQDVSEEEREQTELREQGFWLGGGE